MKYLSEKNVFIQRFTVTDWELNNLIFIKCAVSYKMQISNESFNFSCRDYCKTILHISRAKKSTLQFISNSVANWLIFR
jgi:hypothetical protein